MRVLITGMTSQQVVGMSEGRLPSFSSLVEGALSGGGDSVDVVRPSIHMDEEYLSSYDAVLVGVGQPTSMTCNYLYPACVVGETARRIGNLYLFVDAPEPFRVRQSVSSVTRDEDRLYKELYGRRSGYRQVVGDDHFTGLISSFLTHLRDGEWVTTLYPALPWSDGTDLGHGWPAAGRSHGLVLDGVTVSSWSGGPVREASDPFSVVDDARSQWSRAVAMTLKHPVLPVRGSRAERFGSTAQRVANARLTLVSTFRDGAAWWSPHLSVSLLLGTPVATDWRRTSWLGGSWDSVAASIEGVPDERRSEVALEQLSSYSSALPDRQECKTSIKDILRG